MGVVPEAGARDAGGRRVLVLYDHHWTHVKTIQHYLESFRCFSRHQVSYCTSLAKCPVDLEYFDAVLLHYSVRMCFAGHVSPSFLRALKAYPGLKAIFLQDEYENTHRTWNAIRDLGIRLVFTCVPEESIAKVYPPDQLPGVRFVNVLTGYVPLDAQEIPAGLPLEDRPLLIGYRGRNIGFWYGELGQEKVRIGQRMKEICEARGLPTDIAWDENSRIYGDDWFRFLGRCRATLGSESGCNIFDFDGSLAAQVQTELRRHPELTFDDIHAKYLFDREGEVHMNQISPKIFEAVATRTALVLFEGKYSDVLEPDRHFIPLRKDFSNVDEVLHRLDDFDALREMTDRAYNDVVRSGRWSYQAFVKRVDQALESVWPAEVKRDEAPWLPLPPADACPEFRKKYARNWQTPLLKRLWRWLPAGFREMVRGGFKSMWNRSPNLVKTVVHPVVNRVKVMFKSNA